MGCLQTYGLFLVAHYMMVPNITWDLNFVPKPQTLNPKLLNPKPEIHMQQTLLVSAMAKIAAATCVALSLTYLNYSLKGAGFRV